jgi:hypothetical protein
MQRGRSESDGNTIQVLEEVLTIQGGMIRSSSGRKYHHIYIALLCLHSNLTDRINGSGQDTTQCLWLLLNLIQHVRLPGGDGMLRHEHAPFLKKPVVERSPDQLSNDI